MNNKKLITAWSFYDWANSVYNLVITATIFPIYYNAVTIIKDEHGREVSNVLNFLGIELKNTALYDYALASAFLLVAIIVPVLSGIADFGGHKKRFMKFFAYLGSLSCLLMFFFTKDTLGLGILFAITACMGYSGSLVFYNAYLPVISSPEKQDRVSAKGFAMGYIGSSILLILNLLLIQYHEWFGIHDRGLATRISFLTVGIWWIGFAQIPFYYLPASSVRRKFDKRYLFKGYQELLKVFRELRHQPRLTRFLMAFFAYSMGLQTVVLVATHFGATEIKMEAGQLIITILIIQFLAVAGAYIFSYLSKKQGNVFTLKIATLFWAAICIGTYLFVYTPEHFYVVAACVGLVMGGTQALSRSTYSKMLPQAQEHSSYFSFYDVTEKMSIVMGMLSFGIFNQLSPDMRQPTLIVIAFFIAGFLLLFRVKGSAVSK
ncbi:MAG: MFS transporter [Bacteroidia bacterium]|nr:MFS transporter [Bacteroidia bacterium]